MFRMWGKIFHENRMLKDTVICIDTDLNRTRKVYQALEEICYEFDLSKMILSAILKLALLMTVLLKILILTTSKSK